MEQYLFDQKIHNKLIEPIICVDLDVRKVVYCNEACKYLELIHEDMSIEELSKVIVAKESYHNIAKQVINMDKECVVQSVEMITNGESTVHGDLHITHGKECDRQLYFMLRYKPEDVQYVFMKNRCFELIYTMSFSYPFCLNIEKKEIHFIGPVLSHFKVAPIMKNYPEEVIHAGVIHKDDIEIFRDVVRCMYQGIHTDHVFRTYTDDGTILWYTAKYVVSRDKYGNPVEIVGEFVNVQEIKELEIKMHTDELTGCYNKNAFQMMVSEKLSSSTQDDKHALIIVDVDNFKTINDNLGHPYGDTVLKEMGDKLHTIFHDGEYIGRIGGDEFMIFVPCLQGKQKLINYLEQVIVEFNQTFLGKTREYKTTASIGVATYPQDGFVFQDLYDCSDMALYDVKSRGKNAYRFYQASMSQGNMNNTTPFDVASRALSQHFDKQLISDIFSLLTQALDYEASINKVLELLGRRFNAQRCYIFEFIKDDSYHFDNTYEWCQQGFISQKDNLKSVPKEIYQPMINNSNEDGVFYCNDLSVFQGEPIQKIMVEQNIQSFLISFNKFDGEVVNMIGFDDCTKARIWSPIEIATLMHASKIIAQSLKYNSLMKASERMARDKLRVLDELNSYAYIIDDETAQLLYFNVELKKAFPNVKKGDFCYQVLHGKNERCTNCPILKMKDKNKLKYRCIMPIQKLNQNMLVNTTYLGQFEGRSSTFFSCGNLEDLDDYENDYIKDCFL